MVCCKPKIKNKNYNDKRSYDRKINYMYFSKILFGNDYKLGIEK